MRSQFRPPRAYLLSGDRQGIPLIITTGKDRVWLDFGRLFGMRLRVLAHKVEGRSNAPIVWWDRGFHGSFRDTWGGEEYTTSMVSVRVFGWRVSVVHYRNCRPLPPLRQYGD